MKLKGVAGKEGEPEQVKAAAPFLKEETAPGQVHAFALVCCCCCRTHKKSARASPQPGSCAIDLDHKNITTT